MVHNVRNDIATEPGEFERHLGVEYSRKKISRENIPITALWLRNLNGKAQVLAENNGKHGRKWFLVMEESLDSAFSHIAEVGGILDSPEDPLTRPK